MEAAGILSSSRTESEPGPQPRSMTSGSGRPVPASTASISAVNLSSLSGRLSSCCRSQRRIHSRAASRSSCGMLSLLVTGEYHFGSYQLRPEDVTGQVRYSSHLDTIVMVAVGLVNALTAGEARGRCYLAPAGDDLPAAVTAVLRAANPGYGEVAAHDAAELRAAAAQFRAVFEAVA